MPIRSTKKFGLFNDKHELIKYYDAAAPIKVLSDDEWFMPVMADAPFVKCRVDTQEGYIKKTIVEEARS